MSGHLNNFCYIEGRNVEPWPPDEVVEPGGITPLTAINPKVPVTRGQKTIAVAQANVAVERAMVGQPDPPTPPKVVWTQTRAVSPLALEGSRSRTSMLSEKRANG